MFGLATSQNGGIEFRGCIKCLVLADEKKWMAADLSWAKFWRRKGIDTSTFDGCSTVSTLKGRRGFICKDKDW